MIRYLITLLLGMITGSAAFVALLYINPFAVQDAVSPLSVASSQTMSLSYSTAASDALVYTNNGETRIKPHPDKVLQLWEAAVRSTSAVATTLSNSRGEFTGIGVKFSSDSERTSLIDGQALIDSVWQIYIPGRGSLFIVQTENYWTYLRDIVLPAFWSSADNWKGIWHGTLTSGPGSLGLARVTGGSGAFAEFNSVATESVTVQAYSVEQGPVAVDAQLTIELPRVVEAATDDGED